MEIKIILWGIATVVSMCLYRAGGQGKEPTENPKWMPMWLRHSWCRDWLIPMFSLGGLLIWWQPDGFVNTLIPFVCSYGLMGGAFSTYWDWINGKDNFWLHGFFVGLSIFPFVFFGLAWWIVLLQAVVSAVAMGVWSLLIGTDYVEEMGRGAIATLIRII